MKVAIVGAAGNMGRWFTTYFSKPGNKVKIYDTNRKAAKELAKEATVEYTPTLRRCIEDCDTILVSVPIDITPIIITKIGKLIEHNAVVVEIASIKTPVFSALKRLKKPLIPLSLHPLFGPGLRDLRFGRIIVVKVNDVELEAKLAKELFPEATILTCDVEAHDKMVAYSLALPYFMNLAYGLSILHLNMADLRQHAGTTLSIQLDILEAIMQGSKHLISAILTRNPYSSEVINDYLKAAKTLSKHIRKENGLEKLLIELEEHLSSDPMYQRAYKSLYDLTEKKVS